MSRPESYEIACIVTYLVISVNNGNDYKILNKK